ncbi:hypothetical protein [Tropicimonas sp. S265A]|uniref:hypothetical protein n=1 Tax=Tropicimonas sp. S265A TaxID=3415134 RepID=UPI003C7E849E
MQDQFTKMVGSSAHLTKRHEALLEEVKSRALSLGVHLSDDDVIGSVSFRTCVYGNHDLDFDEVIGDLEKVPAVVEWKAVQRLVERLEAGDPDAAEEIGGTPREKLVFARENGLTGRAEIDAKLNDAQIAAIRDPGRRIAAYRKKHEILNEEIQRDERFMSPAAKIAHFRKQNGGQTS